MPHLFHSHSDLSEGVQHILWEIPITLCYLINYLIFLRTGARRACRGCRHVRPRCSRDLWPGSTQHRPGRTAHTGTEPVGTRPPWSPQTTTAEKGWIQEGAEWRTVKKKKGKEQKEGISFDAEDQRRNKTLICLRRPRNSHRILTARGHGGVMFVCGNEKCVDASVFINHAWWREIAVDFLSLRAQTILIMYVCVCVCVGSLHQCSDWGVTIATGDEVVLGDTWWGDEWYVWCCVSSCVSAGEFGSLTGSSSHHLPSSLKVPLLSLALGAVRHKKKEKIVILYCKD